MNLTDRRIYKLPNGRELVACMTGENQILLISLNDSALSRYELNAAGRLLVDGQLTAWQKEDLFDTERVAGPEVTSLLEAVTTAQQAPSKEKSVATTN